eukprot:TRINITY_DN2949_c1_g1_i2.p1 TRINITY_DN2949_c1_g1~~TRINITY_DN2949_c1_g1_i2.p1  ORF type:complete len:204 (-),score=41.42 TRINITY_DN2949_c1_g1_i2:113-724(-)
MDIKSIKTKKGKSKIICKVVYISYIINIKMDSSKSQLLIVLMFNFRFGVCRLFDVCYCNESTSIFFYGFSSEGRKYLNDGFVGGPGGNTIPDDVNSLIIDLELNTHTCELKTIFYECNGMDVYYEYTINVPVPCYPYFNIDQEDLEIEIINFVRQQLVRSEKEQKEDNIKIELEKDILESDKPLEQDQSKKKLLLKQIKELFG